MNMNIEISGKVSSILAHKKASTVWSIGPNAMVFDAIQLMDEKNVGALPVVDNKTLVGVVSERDYTRKVIVKGRSSKDTPVSDIMTKELLTVNPRDSVAECMRIMTEKRVRHLPVLEGTNLEGILSIGDDTGVTDSRTQAVNYNITITDSAGLTDLVVKEFARILTELAALTDTTSWITVFRPTFTDDTGLTDLAVATGSSVTIIVPPATRILIVYPENRIDTIPAETRTGPIAADPRLLTTAVDPRIEVVPQEDRLMPAQYLKDSNATLDYGINWAPWLGADTITASAWTVQTGLTIATPAASFTTTTTTIWLSEMEVMSPRWRRSSTPPFSFPARHPQNALSSGAIRRWTA
jgi:predicted transcriptional regulator